MSEPSKTPDRVKEVVVQKEPLALTFHYTSGNIKYACGETLIESEWDNIALDEGRELPDRREPFFTKAEVIQAKEALKREGIRLG